MFITAFTRARTCPYPQPDTRLFSIPHNSLPNNSSPHKTVALYVSHILVSTVLTSTFCTEPQTLTATPTQLRRPPSGIHLGKLSWMRAAPSNTPTRLGLLLRTEALPATRTRCSNCWWQQQKTRRLQRKTQAPELWQQPIL